MKNSTKITFRFLCALLCAAALLAVFSACEVRFSNESGKKEGLYIVCTIFPQYDFVKNIVGDLATVELLMPPGSETHNFGLKDISAQKLNELFDADLIVGVGGESDKGFLEDLQKALPADMKFVRITSYLSELLDELETAGMSVDGDEEEEDEDEEGFDEHVWTSPKRAIEIVNGLLNDISALDGEHKDAYKANADAYIAQLQTLDAEFEAVTAVKTVDTLIFADRFPFRYLCYDYGIKADAAFQGCSSSIEPSTATLDYLYKKAAELKVPAILYMEGSKPVYAQNLAQKVGAQALMLHSCHIVSEKEFNEETYISLQRKNIEVLKTALGVKSEEAV